MGSECVDGFHVKGGTSVKQNKEKTLKSTLSLNTSAAVEAAAAAELRCDEVNPEGSLERGFRAAR